MAIYKLKLRRKYQVATNTIVFEFEKPTGFSFKPGQYGGFTLINPPIKDPGGMTRRFSILSTPEDPHIAIVTRLQNSPYKKMLNELNPGDEIKFAGPTGIFTLKEDVTTPTVLLAGGIGIAPFYCMLQDAAQKNNPRSLTLFYGNQTPQDSAFLNELEALQTKCNNLHIINTFAKPEIDWQGETGFINEKLIRKYVSDINQPYYYICGSPAMVTAIQEMLAELNINEDRIFTEDFPGY